MTIRVHTTSLNFDLIGKRLQAVVQIDGQFPNAGPTIITVNCPFDPPGNQDEAHLTQEAMRRMMEVLQRAIAGSTTS